MATDGARYGAYGLALTGVHNGAAIGLVPAPDDWLDVTVERIVDRDLADDALPETLLDDTVLTHRLLTGGWLRVDRETRHAEVHTPFEVDDAALVHPYLAPIAVVWSWWLGRLAFHGGGVVLNGRVWGVLGHKEAGKSTLLAGLAGAGYDVVADDALAVEVEGDTPHVLAGPRAIDLRPATVAHLRARGGEVALDEVRGGERGRLRLPPIAPRLPLAGFVIIEDGDEVALTLLSVAERLRRLAPYQALLGKVPDGVSWLGVGALPTYELRRPRTWDGLAASIGALGALG